MCSVLLELFKTFFMIGLVSFGGGYAMIPFFQGEVVERHGWMTAQELSDTIAVAGMAPGPFATNSAIFIGYHEAGIVGAIIAALGMTLPPFIIIFAVGAIFYKIHHHTLVQSVLYGLRAVVTGLIIYAAFIFALHNGLIGSISWQTAGLAAIYLASLIALIRFRMHPVAIIVLSGLVGVAIYS